MEVAYETYKLDSRGSRSYGCNDGLCRSCVRQHQRQLHSNSVLSADDAWCAPSLYGFAATVRSGGGNSSGSGGSPHADIHRSILHTSRYSAGSFLTSLTKIGLYSWVSSNSSGPLLIP
jgi:hypothetical protein